MEEAWIQKYTKLTDFISTHPDISISENMVKIPAASRTDFYQLFDEVRTSFLMGISPTLVDEAILLSKNYTEIEGKVIGILNLGSISCRPSIDRFLHNPAHELPKILFDSLFDLLKGKIDKDYFVSKGKQDIKYQFKLLYTSGYQKWLSLELIGMLEPDNLLQVNLREIEAYSVHKRGGLQENVPTPVLSRDITFRYMGDVRFTVPDYIIHSIKLNRYFSIRSEIVRPLVTASNVSSEREWFPLNMNIILRNNPVLIYTDNRPSNLSLVADSKNICRPDLILEFIDQGDWLEKQSAENIKALSSYLRPKSGTYIISKEPVPEQASMSMEDDIKVLNVGFDKSKLDTIIIRLIDKKGEAF